MTYKDTLGKISKYLLCALPFIAFLTPAIAAYFINSIYIYSNGWDEPNYLTYQGAMSARNAPGYYLLYIVTLLHEFGISGSIQNLIFDLTIPLSIFFITLKIFRRYGLERSYSYLISSIFIFSPLLFNKSSFYGKMLEPLVGNFFVIAEQTSLPIFRTPNPQFSYLIIAVTAVLYLKYRRRLILAAPLPFLYLFVAVPYSICIFPIFISNGIKNQSLKATLIYSLLGYIICSITLYLLLITFLANAPIDTSLFGLVISKSHFPMISPAAFFSTVAVFISLAINRNNQDITKFIIILTISALGSLNLQVINGVRILPWGFDGHGIGINASLILSLLLFSILSSKEKTHSHTYAKLLSVTIILFLSFLSLKSNDFHFDQMKWRIYKGADISKENIEKVIKNPMRALIPHNDVSSRFSYAYAKLPLLPFSYQYDFPGVTNTCPELHDLHSKAFIFALENVHESNFAHEEYKKRFSMFKKRNLNTKLNISESLCAPYIEIQKNFFIVPFKNQTWTYFP